MNKKFVSIIAISFCAGCGLFADEAVDVQPTEVVAPQEASASCCGKNMRNDEPVARCGKPKKSDEVARCKNCGDKAKADESTLAGCGCGKGGKEAAEIACNACEEEVVEELACGQCNEEEEVAAELACGQCNEEDVADAFACCGHCDEEASEEQVA